MARPERNTIDYYPHIVGEGKKMFFIENKYGNDGYATWHKILEKLSTTDYHYLNLNKEEEVMFLAAKCRVSEDLLLSIITDISKLGKFDKKLWENKVIWCQSFIDSIQDAYKKRNNKCISIEGLRILLTSLGVLKQQLTTKNGDGNTQSKVEYTKEEESKVDESKDSLSDSPIGEQTNPKGNKWIETFDDRKAKFRNDIGNYLKSSSNPSGYPREMLINFFDFWSEQNKSKSRMKFEIEKTWDLTKRIVTWDKNSSRFDKPQGLFKAMPEQTPVVKINHDSMPHIQR